MAEVNDSKGLWSHESLRLGQSLGKSNGSMREKQQKNNFKTKIKQAKVFSNNT